MCLKCLRLVWPVRLHDSNGLFDLIERIKGKVTRGDLQVIQSSAPLEEVGRHFPIRDAYFYALRCGECGWEFQLNMDTYHGNGWWL